jgi:hypothetical protein
MQVKVEIVAMASGHTFYIGIEHVFMWSRKARQFLNKCCDFEKLDLLRTMCRREAVSDFESKVSESFTTQCALNSSDINSFPQGFQPL